MIKNTSYIDWMLSIVSVQCRLLLSLDGGLYSMIHCYNITQEVICTAGIKSKRNTNTLYSTVL